MLASMDPILGERQQIRRHTRLALTAAVLVAIGPVAYVLSLDHPFLRTSGASAWILMATGVALGFLAWRNDRRRWITAALVSEVAVTMVTLFAFVVLARLPDDQRTHSPARAPEFALTDHTGNLVSLAEHLSKGPVLLVFFRGTW